MNDGNMMEFSFIHLHQGTGTLVMITIPSELYDKYEPMLEDIHRCLAFG